MSKFLYWLYLFLFGLLNLTILGLVLWSIYQLLTKAAYGLDTEMNLW